MKRPRPSPTWTLKVQIHTSIKKFLEFNCNLKDVSTVPSRLAPEVRAFCARALTVLPCLEALLQSLLWYGVQAHCGNACNVFKCAKHWPRSSIFSLGNNKRLQCMRHGECGGCGSTSVIFLPQTAALPKPYDLGCCRITGSIYYTNFLVFSCCPINVTAPQCSLIPDCVTGIFHWHNPSGRTMALGLTQPLTEKVKVPHNRPEGPEGG
jgi:hypothetical protein